METNKSFYNPRDMNSTMRSEVRSFDHPATFKTLTMDSNQKESILKDVDRFLRKKEYYKKSGEDV